MSRPLSVILIQIDSLNRRYLGCYGNRWVKTPNLDAFARRATAFDNHYVSSLPCMPARREIWTGTQEFWWRGWGPLEPWDRPIAYLARQVSTPITTHLVTDHYHFFEWGSHNYSYDFHGYDYIRGHEMDNWRSDTVSTVPDWAKKMIERRPDEGMIYLRNVQGFKDEADFFGPKVMQTAADWLARNHEQEQFFLHVDAFDVHEPFHIPEPYRSLYTDDDYRRYSPWPLYGRTDRGASALSEDEVAWVQAQYAGKLTMTDRWLGRVFDQLERHQLWDRTCVIITTDHGHYLGDHGWMGKPRAPLYHTLCHIPLLIWHPEYPGNGRRSSACTQTVDLYATVLELLGLESPATENIHSRSFGPVIRGERDSHREFAVYAYNNSRIGVTAGDWTLLRDHRPNAAPEVIYTHQVEHTTSFGFAQRQRRRFQFEGLAAGTFIPGVAMPVWRMPLRETDTDGRPEPRADYLFDNRADPDQIHNVASSNPAQVQKMVELLRQQAQAVQAPEEQWLRLSL